MHIPGIALHVQYVAKKSLRSYPNTLLASQRFLKLRLRGFMIIKLFRMAFANCFGKLPTLSKLFRMAFPNCFAKLPEAGELFNLAYSSHICAIYVKYSRSYPKTSQTFLCNVLYVEQLITKHPLPHTHTAENECWGSLVEMFQPWVAPIDVGGEKTDNKV